MAPTCSIDYVIRAPRGTHVTARGSGTGYDLKDMSGDVDIDIDGGDSDLSFAATPTHIRARTDGGDIHISVPPGAAHRVLASADGGSTRVDVATDPDSTNAIDAHANGGDVTIRRSTTSP